MKRHSYFLKGALGFWLFAGLFAAADAGASTRPDKAPEGLSLRLVSTNFSPDIKIPEWGVVGINGEMVPLQLIPWNIAPPVLMEKKDRIAIYDRKELAEALTAKTDLPSPLFSIPLPAGLSKCLMVVKPPVKSGAKAWDCVIYDESAKGYPGGSRLFLNLTPHRLSGSCGKVKFEIPAQGSMLVDPKVRSEDFREIVQVYAHLPVRVATVLDEQWAFLPKSRGVVLVFEADKTIRLVGIADEVPAEFTPGEVL